MERIREQAQALGFMDLPRKTLYARPFIATIRKATYYPEPAEAVEHYIQYSLDIEDFVHERKGRIGKKRQYAYLAPDSQLYVEVLDRVVGFKANKDENHVNKIDIYSGAEEHVQKIANFINEIFISDGILSYMVWEKIEKKFEISREQVIADWENLLTPPENTLKQAETQGLTNQRETILYAVPKSTEKKFGKYYFDITWAVRSYLHGIEPTMIERRHTQKEKNLDSYYFLAPKNELFVQFNYTEALEIKIYSDQPNHIRGIARAADSVFKKGIIAKMKWKNLKKKLNLDINECITAWKQVL